MSVLAAVEVGQLLDVIWISLLAGVVVITAFALVVLETGRSTEARRNGQGGRSAFHATLAVLLFAAFAAIVVVGLVIMLRK